MQRSPCAGMTEVGRGNNGAGVQGMTVGRAGMAVVGSGNDRQSCISRWSGVGVTVFGVACTAFVELCSLRCRELHRVCALFRTGI